jgi:signal transduction histidine kinase
MKISPGCDDQVTLAITDNGQGFEPTTLAASTARSNWGLLNMRERAEAIGGHCQIVARPGAGVSMIIEVMR